MTIAHQNQKKSAKRRSRGGCLSCKSLRIKCDEAKPSCEYCTHTERLCIYVQANARSRTKKSLIVPNINSEYVYHWEEMKANELIVRESIEQVQKERNDALFDFYQNTSLNQTTSQLNISTFELRLLKFFNEYCIHFFSFGVNKIVHNVWKNSVPSLFIQSELVRDSIYAFAAINMFPLFDLDLAKEQDDLHERMQIDTVRGSVSFNPKALQRQDNEDNIYERASKYFASAIVNTNKLIGSNMAGPLAPSSMSDQTAKEFVVSGILTFTFLAMHPHQVVPLVDFSVDSSDYLSICKGIRETMVACRPQLMKTEFRGLFGYSTEGGFIGSLDESTYPLIVRLKRELDMTYRMSLRGACIAREYETLTEVLDTYNRAMHTSANLNYPVPLFRCIALYPDHFHQMIYEKNLFALRLLFVFAGLASIMDFQLFDGSSIWLDYMTWFKEHNMKLFRNTWKYKLDEDFYTVALKSSTFKNDDYSYLSTFDPIRFLNKMI
ncbi:uncharacterized protein RJT20DRAFT_40560 [Scheffersomyces xylosifermentans]|uniref:uncharacterized protein n=1 Tax=Scheffersomyces xylosifermentans TaxID=1304137 RepID=UPI00315D5A14